MLHSKPDLEPEMLAKYRSRRREDLQHCHQFLQKRDYDGLARIGHKLKGNGVTFGFPELSKLGEELENFALASNQFEVAKQVLVLEEWVSAQFKD